MEREKCHQTLAADGGDAGEANETIDLSGVPPMSETSHLSTAQVSRVLGVSVTTVKRWVDDGILPAHKTVGGHRKLLIADVLRLVRENHFPQLDLSQLGHSVQPGDVLDESELSRNLFAALRHGDAAVTHALIEGAYQTGVRVAALADRVIAPAMNRFGGEWVAGRIDVLHEHRGTRICAEALYGLKALLVAQASRHRPAAVGGAPEGHLHSLASQLIELVLLEEGWAPVNLGANTPFAAFRRAIVELQPRLLWLSINPVAEPQEFLAGYRELYQVAQKAGVAVAIGGHGLTNELRAAMPYTTYGDGLTHLAAFAASLYPRPQRRRRGRPHGSH
jgi:MerR family transcriptional regulator, light-induced transcriptional regulator